MSSEKISDVYYFTAYHLFSASLAMDSTGTAVSAQRYTPFGEVRDISSVTALPDITQTDFGYTGQRAYESFGLSDYNARFYSDPHWGGLHNRTQMYQKVKGCRDLTAMRM